MKKPMTDEEMFLSVVLPVLRDPRFEGLERGTEKGTWWIWVKGTTIMEAPSLEDACRKALKILNKTSRQRAK